VPFFLSAKRGAILDPASNGGEGIVEPFGKTLRVLQTDAKDSEKKEAKNVLETGLFLWEQTKRANSTPSTLDSVLKRFHASKLDRD
jgi:hypothetical protein